MPDFLFSTTASGTTWNSSTYYPSASDSSWGTNYPSSAGICPPSWGVWEQPQQELPKEQPQAEARAEELLKEHIGEEAFGRLHKVGHIELNSRKYPGRKYRIPSNHMAYIEVLDEKEKVIDTLCIHPQVECPPADHILSRVILLKFAEDYLLAKANHHEARVHA